MNKMLCCLEGMRGADPIGHDRNQVTHILFIPPALPVAGSAGDAPAPLFTKVSKNTYFK